jgi:site-specific recombinase XerC
VGAFVFPTLSILPYAHQQLPRYFTQEQIQRFFGVIADPRDRAMFALMYHHGLRVGEVLLLRREDVDLVRRRVLVRRLKGGSWGEQILFASTAAALRMHFATYALEPDDALFPGRDGPLRRRQIQLRFVRYRVLAGLASHYTTHSLRHSIATHLLDAGASLEFVQDHLGHRNIRSTAIYARITDRHREAAFRRLAASPWIVQPGASSGPGFVQPAPDSRSSS